MRKGSIQIALFLLHAVSFCAFSATAEASVPVWGQFELTVSNDNTYPNPFTDVTLEATFIGPDREEVHFFGFYDGDGQGNQEGNVWKLRFMPDTEGIWHYSYSWSDGTPGGEGTFQAIQSELPGPISAHSQNPAMWHIEDRGAFVPFFVSGPSFWDVTQPNFDAFLDYVKDKLGANGLSLILSNRVWLECEGNPECSPTQSILSIREWKLLDQYLSELHQRELGANIMFYTDDEGAPGFEQKSEMEKQLLRYAMSRLGAYALVVFDSGIDIGEYRSADWNQWFAQYLLELDPWKHPVGSRHSGGSGSFECPACTYESRGDVHPTYEAILSLMKDSKKPVFFTDRWREDFYRGGFGSDSLRQIMWHCALAGGAGFIVGGRHGQLRLDSFQNDLDNPAQFLAFSDFWRERGDSLHEFSVANELVNRGYCLIREGKEYVIYLEVGGTAEVDLSGAETLLTVEWLNPRTGEYQQDIAVMGGREQDFETPGQGDWVLHIGGERPDMSLPTAPVLRASARDASQIVLSWREAKDPESGIGGYVVYRDGVRIAQVGPESKTYLDNELNERSRYLYQVAAFNGSGIEGPLSRPLGIKTPADTTPPSIASVKAIGPRRIRLFFSEPVEKNSAERPENYSIDGKRTIEDALLTGEYRAVLLHLTTPLEPDRDYILSATGISDLAFDANTISQETTASFEWYTRTTDSLIAFYEFEEDGDEAVRDTSGVGEPLNLEIENAGAVNWGPGYIEVVRPTIVKAGHAAKKIIEACMESGELTLEAWIEPANMTQGGPARIVTLSRDGGNRNFTLGQSGRQYEVRLRTTETSRNGIPSIATSERPEAEGLTHIVYTYSASGERTLYMNGSREKTDTLGGNLSNWDPSYKFALANELSGDRAWLGKIHLIAVYARALSEEEIQKNHAVGPRPYREEVQ